MINKTFEAVDQLDKDGKPIDKIFTISETKEDVIKTTMSGTEVTEFLKYLENRKLSLEKSLQDTQDEINFYKKLK
jgi:hypothetical protein